MNVKKTILILLFLILVGGLSTHFIMNRREKTAQATPSTPLVAVDVATPALKTLHRVVEVFGSLSPKTSTEVKNELPGRVLKMRVKEWDRVKPNDVLLEMDPVDHKLAANRNEAGLKMAKAQLLKSGVDLNRAKREWNRAMKLKEGGLITGQDLDERKTALESAEAGVALAQAQVAQAEAQLAEARHNLEKAVVYASIEGTVSQRNVDAGDWVDKGKLLFTVVDNRWLDFTANVPATDLAEVTEGQVLNFTVDGLPDRSFHGYVKRVNPSVSSIDRSGRILAEVENPEGILKGGLFVRGQVVVQERKDAVVIPKISLVGWNLEKGTARVFVVDESGVARSREVTTGLSDENMVEIRSGLGGNEKIVVRGGFNLREGDRVQEAGQGGETKPRENPS